jgi:hypothetical protein
MSNWNGGADPCPSQLLARMQQPEVREVPLALPNGCRIASGRATAAGLSQRDGAKAYGISELMDSMGSAAALFLDFPALGRLKALSSLEKTFFSTRRPVLVAGG